MSIGVKMSIKDKHILKRGNCSKNLKKQMNKRGKISFQPKIIMFCYFSLLFLSFLNVFQINVFKIELTCSWQSLKLRKIGNKQT